MKVAVTGATGGLGRSLVEFLLSKGVPVIALGRNQKIGRILANQGAQFFSGDVTDQEYLKQAFQGADAIVHSAGLASPFGKWDDFYHANVQGTQAVLGAMQDLGISKLIHISTPSVYFSGSSRENITEAEKLPEQKSNYGRSKLMADHLILEQVQKSNLNAVLLRPRAIFGRYDSTIVPRMIRMMKKGFFPLPDSGKALVDITAVENVVHAIWLSLNSTKHFNGEILNISNDQPTSVRTLTLKMTQIFNLHVKFVDVPMWLLLGVAEIFELMAKLLGQSEPVISKYSIQSIGTTQTLSIEKAKRVLGYEPIISIEDALSNLAK